MRLNNYSLIILKLQHKINLKFLDTNKNTNNFFWCPTGWGNAKIMGANKNIPNFSGLIMPTSLLQSSRCFRQKNFLFLYRWVLRFCPSWQKFILSSRFQGFALLRLLLHLAAPCNSEIPASCRKNSLPSCALVPSMRLIPPGTLRHCKTAYPFEQRMSKGKPVNWSKSEPRAPPPTKHGGSTKKPRKGNTAGTPQPAFAASSFA